MKSITCHELRVPANHDDLSRLRIGAADLGVILQEFITWMEKQLNFAAKVSAEEPHKNIFPRT